MKPQTYINGLRIIEDITMTVAGETEYHRRTMKERLFSWPWNPFKTHNIFIPQIPSTQVIMGDNFMVMHPEIAVVFRESLKNEES